MTPHPYDAAVRRVLAGERICDVARTCPHLQRSTLSWRVGMARRQAGLEAPPARRLPREVQLKLDHLLDEGRLSWYRIARLAGVHWQTVKAHALKREQRRGLEALQAPGAAATPLRRCGLHLTASDPCHTCGARWERSA